MVNFAGDVAVGALATVRIEAASPASLSGRAAGILVPGPAKFPSRPRALPVLA